MTCTNDDLKQIGDCANGYGTHGQHIFLECFTERRVKIGALLRRLETAEDMIKNGCDCRDVLPPGHGCAWVLAWKQACGE